MMIVMPSGSTITIAKAALAIRRSPECRDRLLAELFARLYVPPAAAAGSWLEEVTGMQASHDEAVRRKRFTRLVDIYISMSDAEADELEAAIASDEGALQ